MGFFSGLMTKPKSTKKAKKVKSREARPTVRKDLRKHFYDSYDIKVFLGAEDLKKMKLNRDAKLSLTRRLNQIGNVRVDTTPRNMIILTMVGVNSKEVDQIVDAVHDYFGNLSPSSIQEF